MPPLNDPEILARYKSALANWYVTGYVTWKDPALEWLDKNLLGTTARVVAEWMYRYVEGGGQIDQVPERRPEWNVYPYHYDLRLSVAGRHLYIETVLVDDDPDDPIIHVVSIHDV